MNKILSILFLLLMLAGARGQANITFSMTNSINAPDTNRIKIQPLESYAQADGSYQTTGLPFWIYPNTSGIVSTNLNAGFYLATNQFIVNNFYAPGNIGTSQGIIFAVPQGNGTYPFTLLAQPGYNTYNFNPLLSLYTNVIAVLGFTPLTPTQTTNLFNLCNTNIYAGGTNVVLTVSNGVTLINAVLAANNLTNVVLTTGSTNLVITTNGPNNYQLTVPTQWFLTNGLSTTGFVNAATAPLASTSYVANAIAPLVTTATFTAGTNSVASVALADLIEYSNALAVANAASSNAAYAGNLATSNTLQLTKQSGSLLLSNAVAAAYINTNVYNPGTNVFFFTNSSGIFVEVPYQTWLTNTLGSAAYAPASSFLSTNLLPGLTNGFVTPGSLAAYALISYVQTYAYPTNNPQGFTTPNQVTNIAAYQSLVATQSLGSAAFTATTAYDAAGRALAATNGLGVASGLSAFVSTNAFDTNGAATAATNGVGIPSGLSAFVSTNRFDTNGAANFVYSNNAAGYQTAAQVTNTANSVTNAGNIVFKSNPIFINALTNAAQFIASNSGQGTNLTIIGSFSMGAKTNLTTSTNIIGISLAGSIPSRGTYVGAPFGSTWTNNSSGFQIVLTGGNFYIQSNGVSLYQSSNITNWTAISGALPVPYGAYGAYWDLDGADLRGTPYFPWLLSYLQTNGSSVTSSNASVTIVASLINGHTNYDLAVVGGGGSGGGIAITNGTGYGTTLIGAKQITFTNTILTGGAGTFSITTGLPSNGYFVITGNSGDGSGNSFNGVYTNQNTLVAVGPPGTPGTYAGWQYELATPPGVQQDFICVCTNTATHPGWVSMYNSIAPTFTTTNGAPTLTNSSSFIPNTIPSSFSGLGTPVATYYLPASASSVTNQIYADTNSGYLDIAPSLNIIGNLFVNGSPPIIPLGFNTNSVVGGLSLNNYFSPQGTNVIVGFINAFGVNPTNGITAANATNISAYQTLLGTNGLWSAINTVVSNTLYGQIVTATNGALIDTTNYVNIVSNSLAGQISAGGIPTLLGIGTNTTLKNAISIGVTNGTVYNVLSFPILVGGAGGFSNAYFTVTGSGTIGGESVNGTYTNQNTLNNGPPGVVAFGGYQFQNESPSGGALYIAISTNIDYGSLYYCSIYSSSAAGMVSTNPISILTASQTMYTTNGSVWSGSGTATMVYTILAGTNTINQIYSDTNTGYLDLNSNVDVSGNLYVQGQPLTSLTGGSGGVGSTGGGIGTTGGGGNAGLSYLATSNLLAGGGILTASNFNGSYTLNPQITSSPNPFDPTFISSVSLWTNSTGPIGGTNYFILAILNNTPAGLPGGVGYAYFQNFYWFCTCSNLTNFTDASFKQFYLNQNGFVVGNYGAYQGPNNVNNPYNAGFSSTNWLNVSYQVPTNSGFVVTNDARVLTFSNTNSTFAGIITIQQTNNTTGSAATATWSTNLAGAQAAIIAGVTTNFTTPEQFGAVGNGIADDSAAWSNMAAAVSARLSAPTVYASKKYVCLTTGYNFATSNFMMFGGGTIYTGDTNHWVIGRPNGTPNLYNNWTVDNMTFIRTNATTAAPNTNCYGIWLATDDPTNQGSYWLNWNIQNCTFIGFKSAIVDGGGCKGNIINNNTWQCWSNMVTFMGPNYVSDHINIFNNDFNSLDYPALPISTLQGLSVIEFDGENLGVDMELNDISGACQVIKVLPTSPGIALKYYQNEVETMYNNNTNLTLLQLWNSSWQIGYSAQCGYGPAFFGSSNYLGYVGAYASNQLSLRLDHITSMSPSLTICHVDVWQNGSTNGSGYADGCTSPDIDPPLNWLVTTHTNFLDAGFSTIGSNHKFSESLFTNIIPVSATGLPSGVNPVLNFGPGIMTINNWNGGFIEFVKSVAFDAPFAIPNSSLFEFLEENGGGSAMQLYANQTHNIVLSTTNQTHADFQDTNGIVQVNSPLITTNTVTLLDGISGNGSGLTNLIANVQPETLAYAQRIAAAGGNISAQTLQAVDEFILRGKGVGWWTNILDCWCPLGDYIGAQQKLVMGGGFGILVSNFTAANYSEAKGWYTDNNSYSLQQCIDTQFIPGNNGLTSSNFSLALSFAGDNGIPNTTFAQILGSTPGGLSGENNGDPFIDACVGNGGLNANACVVNSMNNGANVVLGYTTNYSITVQNAMPATTNFYSTPAAATFSSSITLFRQERATGTFIFYSVGGVGFYSMGKFMSASQELDLSQAIRQLMNSIRVVNQKPNLLVLGDSVAAMSDANLVNTLAASERWPALVASAIGMQEVNMSQGSRCMATNNQVPIQYYPGIIIYTNLLDGYSPGCVVALGVNDKRNDPLKGTTGTTNIMVAVSNDLVTVITALKLEGKKVVDVGPYYDTLSGDGVSNLCSANYAFWCSGAAKFCQVPYVDSYQLFTDTNAASLIYDGAIHPNLQGHAVLGAAILKTWNTRDLFRTPQFVFPSILATSTYTTNFTINGALWGMPVVYSLPPSFTAGLSVDSCFVVTNDTVSLTIRNNTVSPITPVTDYFNFEVHTGY